MHKIEVKAEHLYSVTIGADWRQSLIQLRSLHHKVLIIAPQSLVSLVGLEDIAEELAATLFIVPEAEAQKEINNVNSIWEFLGEHEFGRKDAIVAIGGGATTDLGGFVAATWLRGIDWYAFPTSLAGMVDASVGGKTGINTKAGKNLVGSFYSPRSVVVDLSWLESLPDRDFSAGLAEVIKTGYIRDHSILELLKEVSSVENARRLAPGLIAKSVSVKAEVVSSDFKEGKLREILNFGHTFGHAIEKSSGYSLRHGEAVSIGLHFAALLSEELLDFPREETLELVHLLSKFSLPTSIARGDYSWDDLLSIMSGDKKSRSGKIRFVGLTEIGEPAWLESVEPELLRGVYERIIK